VSTRTRLFGGRINQRRRTAVLRPPVPVIVVGNFKGRRVSELLDDELQEFLKADARRQTGRAYLGQRTDARHYWCALYEVERRKLGSAHPAPTVSLEIADFDTSEEIALKLVRHGFRQAAIKYHPDHLGGDNTTMRRLIAARELAVKRLKIKA
jgi:hypothetical protein